MRPPLAIWMVVPLLATILLVGAKLLGLVALSWWLVTAPIWLPLCAFVAFVVVILIGMAFYPYP